MAGRLEPRPVQAGLTPAEGSAVGVGNPRVSGRRVVEVRTPARGRVCTRRTHACMDVSRRHGKRPRRFYFLRKAFLTTDERLLRAASRSFTMPSRT